VALPHFRSKHHQIQWFDAPGVFWSTESPQIRTGLIISSFWANEINMIIGHKSMAVAKRRMDRRLSRKPLLLMWQRFTAHAGCGYRPARKGLMNVVS
jgi:hypothetical protein